MAKILKDAKAEVARLRACEATYLNDLPPLSTLDDVRARELTDSLFALNKQWKAFESITSYKIFHQFPEVERLYMNLVDSDSSQQPASPKVSPKEFWQRYKYWCDERRCIKELQRRKEERVLNQYQPGPGIKAATENEATTGSPPRIDNNEKEAEEEAGTDSVQVKLDRYRLQTNSKCSTDPTNSATSSASESISNEEAKQKRSHDT